MVLSRSAVAEATRSLKGQLAERFLMDAQLFARFEERFAQYQPAIIDRYSRLVRMLTSGRGLGLLAGVQRNAHDAAEIFEQAMKELEIFACHDSARRLASSSRVGLLRAEQH